MKKRSLSIILALLLCLTCSFPAFAESSSLDNSSIGDIQAFSAELEEAFNDNAGQLFEVGSFEKEIVINGIPGTISGYVEKTLENGEKIRLDEFIKEAKNTRSGEVTEDIRRAVVVGDNTVYLDYQFLNGYVKLTTNFYVPPSLNYMTFTSNDIYGVPPTTMAKLDSDTDYTVYDSQHFVSEGYCTFGVAMQVPVTQRIIGDFNLDFPTGGQWINVYVDIEATYDGN